ncbi:class I SAM-dependent methyltransferase [Paralimibaculum aggregatum]|uniref:Class I SAM-dependent methyltransferase n=1 Tax=Paralimibaculum aggregatum TaxID=3036245 RepID=A0ABQ6LHN4_9RHOB|nr:methyltransferase domain-containing protein [Limibaculum sp. NKW23]GMG81639.1 class I SAM-dependent methyltransferase [Limibaculum sp. NKW23]
MDNSDTRGGDKDVGLEHAYRIETPEEAEGFYDRWAPAYDAEVGKNGYITPKRCAEALAAHAALPWAPVMDLACGTGLSGLALRAAGFDCIDGFDLSEEMLARARRKDVYRELAIADLSKPLEMPGDVYQNAAAIGCISPEYMPPTVLDEIVGKLPSGGCLVFSVNDHAAADGTIRGRINDLIDCGYTELLVADYGAHLPGIGLKATVYVLRRR